MTISNLYQQKDIVFIPEKTSTKFFFHEQIEEIKNKNLNREASIHSFLLSNPKVQKRHQHLIINASFSNYGEILGKKIEHIPDRNSEKPKCIHLFLTALCLELEIISSIHKFQRVHKIYFTFCEALAQHSLIKEKKCGLDENYFLLIYPVVDTIELSLFYFYLFGDLKFFQSKEIDLINDPGIQSALHSNNPSVKAMAELLILNGKKKQLFDDLSNAQCELYLKFCAFKDNLTENNELIALFLNFTTTCTIINIAGDILREITANSLSPCQQYKEEMKALNTHFTEWLNGNEERKNVFSTYHTFLIKQATRTRPPGYTLQNYSVHFFNHFYKCFTDIKFGDYSNRNAIFFQMATGLEPIESALIEEVKAPKKKSKGKKKKKIKVKTSYSAPTSHKIEEIQIVELEKSSEEKPENSGSASPFPLTFILPSITELYTYSKRVEAWFQEYPNHLNYEPYSNLSYKLQKIQHLFHAFSREVDKYILNLCYNVKWKNEKTEHLDDTYAAFGAVKHSNKEYQGLFVYTVGKDKKIYHRYFSVKPPNELSVVLTSSLLELHFPPLKNNHFSSKNGGNNKEFDDSKDTSNFADYHSIVIQDEFHKAKIILYPKIFNALKIEMLPA